MILAGATYYGQFCSEIPPTRATDSGNEVKDALITFCSDELWIVHDGMAVRSPVRVRVGYHED
jgi:hypothetical protein